jgi:type II secretory ATPase GspE/PulE/Tfp pilus assembly ATPase PilB-like protein
VSLAISTPTEIRTVLGRLRSSRTESPAGVTAAPISDTELLGRLGQLLVEAAESRVSNVHVIPGPGGLGLRLRRDGLLEERGLPLLPADQQRLLELVRRLAGLDPRDRKTPRSGRFRLPVGDREGLNVEVSFAPTIAGERLSVKLLETPGPRRSLEELGFVGQSLLQIRRLLREPAGGLILVAGPGRSGRSTTLGAMLAELPAARALFSVEDPVEQRLPGIHQMQVDATLPGDAGAPAALLAAALAQDADAVMVSHISEPRTVAQAVSAAFGGCLVLGAVTAVDALSTLRLLLERGAEPFLLGSALRGVVAQRLVRTLCTGCRRAVYRMPEELVRIKDRLGLAGSTLFEPAGCSRCGYRGWAGRTVVQEVLASTPELAEALQEGQSHSALRQGLTARGHPSLLVDGYKLVLAGLTTPEEVQRVLGGLAQGL